MTDIRESKELGLGFEEEMAQRLGLERVPGSGSGPFHKLDLSGLSFRVSLKFTRFKANPITVDEMDEALDACFGPGGTGDFPLWIARMGGDEKYDLVMMQPEVLERIAKGELRVGTESRAEARRRMAALPPMFRDEDDGAA